MSPRRGSPSTAAPLSRRRLLAAGSIAVTGSLAGCSRVLPSAGSEGEGDAIEILVENRTDEQAHVGVRVEDGDGAALFSRVYSVESGHMDQSAGIDTRPATVRVFTPDGTAATWEYAPDLDIDCEGEDIGIALTEEGFESWYAC